VKEFCDKIFFGRMLLISKSFQLLEILCFKNILGWKFLEKYHMASNRVNWEKGIILSHRFCFVIAQAFFFLDEKYCVEFLHGFILEKLYKCFDHQ